MDELSLDEFDEVMRAPQPKSRGTKVLERDVHTWFYGGIVTLQGKCENPNCLDKRKRNLVYVWEHPSGISMCRICFLGGWEPDIDEGD